MAITFQKDTRFLFIGDSVTDSGRSADPEGIGNGYVRLIRDYLQAKHPPIGPVVINRGSSSDRITDLAARWQRDVIAERPDVLSILIGVNDQSQHMPAPGTAVSIDQFRTIYRHVLTQTADQLPRCRLVLCEPAALWSNTPTDADENLRTYANALMDMVGEFDAVAFVPLHAALVYARHTRPDIPWTTEAGQLTSAGHMLIAYTWMEEAGMIPRAIS